MVSCSLSTNEEHLKSFRPQAASLHDFNAWLIECEEKLGDAVVNKPKTRIEACQLLASITVSLTYDREVFKHSGESL